MEMLIVLFLGCLGLTATVHGQDQSGFISIDCGTSPGSSYFDATTKMYYVSDSEFIDTGKNYDVSEEHNLRFKGADQQLMNVRSFPEGAKNCYTLRPQRGRDHKYLVRASFMYGNYDSKDHLPVFKLYLGVDEWDTVKFNNSHDIVRKEIIHVPVTDYIYVCLVNIGSGSPFISTLELRQLNNSIYTTQSGSLLLLRRLDIGSTRNQTVRYNDDAFDRLWEPFSHPYWKSVRLSYGGYTSSDNPYKPPSRVMATAVSPVDESGPLEFHLNLDNSTRQFYVYLHFFEVEDLRSNQLREFYVSLNGWFLTPEPIVPGRLVPHTVFSANSISTSSELSISIYKTHRSTLPPILNALEIYEMKQLFRSSTVQSNVDAIKKIKMVYKVKKNWQGDPCLPIEFSWNGLSCSNNNSISPSIISLNLSCGELTGKIDSSFSNLTSLKYLDLSFNSLTGNLPNFLAELPSLKILNLSGNNLTGSVPLALLEKSINGSLSLRLDGNPYLCEKNFCEDEEEDKEKMKDNATIPVVASVISVLVLLLGEMAAFWIFKRRKQHDVLALDSKNRQISYSEVDRITDSFKKSLGQGASAKVYLGHLSDGTEVAVKILTPSSVLVFKQFNTEAQLLGKIHHKNLVSLIGYCDEGSSMVLVYEHMAKGNLKEYLTGEKVVVLSWEQRLQIAIDAAQALDYLHDGCNPPIIHRDVKTENILLNEKFEAKVADFGWSRSLPSEGGRYVSTVIVGTPGYVDPEYSWNSVPSKKNDVYSFGIVLLELISGRPAILRITEDSTCHIADWARLVTAKGDIKKIIDPRLQGEFKANSPHRAVKTAMSCVSVSSTDRPIMSQVVGELKECLRLAIAHEETDSVEDQGPVSIEAVCERADNVDGDHDPFGSEVAYESADDAEVGHDPFSHEDFLEVTDNSEEDHKRNENGQDLVGIEAAHEIHDNGKDDHGPVGFTAAHEIHDIGKDDHSPVGIATVYEIIADSEEDQGPLGIDATKETTRNMNVNNGAVGIKIALKRNDNGEEDHGPVGIEAVHETSSTVEYDHGHLGIQAAKAIQESTNLYEESREKEKNKNVVPAAASITSVVTTSGNVVKRNEDDKTFDQKSKYFSYSEVERVTEDFQIELGKGASATVYLGHLSDGTEVAVKKLFASSTLGLKQFRTEAQLLTRVHHKNLVSLFGYCDEGSNMVLIYEYMAMGNLKAYLSGKREAILSWEQRLRIAIDAAQALEYLHNGCNPPIIHRDVKTDNILLNEKLQAKMADFGWSKSMPAEDGSYISTAIVGTPGYLDPEYHRNSVPNEKTDVYSFGIVLLELISSRPAIIKDAEDGPCNIINWVRPIIAKGDIRRILDPRLLGAFENNSARRAIKIAMSCASFSSTDRPITSDIVAELRECLKIAMAHKRAKNLEEGQTSVGIEAATAVQESMYGNQGYKNTEFNRKAGEREKEKQAKKMKMNFITSVLAPAGALASLVKSKKKWPQAKDKSYLEFRTMSKSAAHVSVDIEDELKESMPDWKLVSRNQRLSYYEVERITNKFRELIGQGGSGSVYLGHLSSGDKVAVKKLSTSPFQVFRQFQNEAQLLSTIHHRNLVSLIGYCHEGLNMLLIYEYMANGNLEEHLSGRRGSVLSWEQRLEIGIESAQGLEYLHNGCSPSIVHRDVKAANILLDDYMQVKIGDFGWSKSMFCEDSSHVLNTIVVGTAGYLDPEYQGTGCVIKESDVYSFGIVLLELISGRPAKLDDGRLILEWIQPFVEGGEIEAIMDPRLEGDGNTSSAWRALDTAMSCVQLPSQKRPKMSHVVNELKECLKLVN